MSIGGSGHCLSSIIAWIAGGIFGGPIGAMIGRLTSQFLRSVVDQVIDQLPVDQGFKDLTSTGFKTSMGAIFRSGTPRPGQLPAQHHAPLQ